MAAGAVERLVNESDPDRLEERVASNMRAMARFFWFTIEFGLMRARSSEAHEDPLRVYGSGLLSSYGEIEHAVESSDVQRFPFQLEWVVNQGFRIDRFQPLLFVVDSFEHLFEEVNRLETWVGEGRLDNVAPGEPVISEEEVRISLEAARSG